MALTGADAAVARAQREDVAWPPKRFGRGGGRGEGSAGEGAVVGRDAGGDGRMGGVDGKRVGGSVGIGVFENHLGQGEGSREGGGDGSTDQATRVSDHKGHLVGSYVLGCTDEVALILAVCRIEDDDEFAISKSVYRVLDRVEMKLGEPVDLHLQGWLLHTVTWRIEG